MISLLIADFAQQLAGILEDGKGTGRTDLFDAVYFLLSTIREDRSVLLFNLWLMANYDETAQALKNQLENDDHFRRPRFGDNACKICVIFLPILDSAVENGL